MMNEMNVSVKHLYLKKLRSYGVIVPIAEANYTTGNGVCEEIRLYKVYEQFCEQINVNTYIYVNFNKTDKVRIYYNNQVLTEKQAKNTLYIGEDYEFLEYLQTLSVLNVNTQPVVVSLE